MHTTWVEIDRAALLHNVRTFRALLGAGGAAMMAVVKGNAYGHGMADVARAVEAEVDWYGVNSLDEALALRAAGCTLPTLILGASAPERQSEIVRAGFRQVVYDRETAALVAREAARAGVRAAVHLEVETGTNRLGARHEALCALAAAVRAEPSLELEGLFTHYANIEDTIDGSYADHQLGRFRAAVAAVEAGGPVPIKHSAASAATILYPQTYFTMARVGVGLYGLWPSEDTREAARRAGLCVDLRPVLSWKARLVHLNDVPFGEPVGYGCTYVATRPRRIGVIPVGYYEGLDRGLSNRGRVLVRGRTAPIVGRVAMNMTMIDVSEIPDAAVGDDVVIIGRQAERAITAEDVAALLDTINYEVVTRIGPSAPRVWVNTSEG
ncbi:MAG: alanine racemase [Dehalococcoidia bacterium]